MKKHIESWFLKASHIQTVKGKIWYKEACKLAHSKGRVNAWKLAQIISVLSPQVDWETNKKNALLVWDCLQAGNDIHGVKIFATCLQKDMCERIYNNTDEIPTTAVKTYNFANNIYNPINSDYITIDRHAVKVALNDLKAGGVAITKKQYKEVSKAYTAIANKHMLLPCELQAITWLTYKDTVGR